MKISELVEKYVAELPIGSLLTEEQMTRSLRDAVRQYCGYARLVNAKSLDHIHTPIDASPEAVGDQDFDLTASELAIIKPLWLLYMERETAMALEASRSQGADVWGRSTAEAIASIAEYEALLPQRCFTYAVVSI